MPGPRSREEQQQHRVKESAQSSWTFSEKRMRPWFLVGISVWRIDGRAAQEDAGIGVGGEARQELAWEAVPGPGHL